jgi:nicotinate-nucleotide adenylyltransferase
MDPSSPPDAAPTPAPDTVALLGGSFDPPHVCHVLISLYVLQSGRASQVWWIPCKRHAFDKRMAPFVDRLAMCEAATRWLPAVRVDPLELELDGPSYTLATVRELARTHPGRRFVWIAGSDVLPDLPRWHRWSELAAEVPFVIIPRGDDDPPPPPAGTFHHLPIRFPDVSSTGLREALRSGAVVDGLIDSAVAHHIRERDLYRD